MALWDQALAWLRRLGPTIVDVSLPHTKYGLAAYYIIAPAEASSNLARYDGVRFGHRVEGADLTDLYERTRADGFGEEVRRRILIGTYVLSAGYYDAYYTRAQKSPGADPARLHRGVPRRGRAADADDAERRLRAGREDGRPGDHVPERRVHRAGRPGGHAGMSVPAGLDGAGLPLGLQVMGRPFDEETVFAVGAAIEHAAGFTARPRLRAGEMTHGG